MSDVALLEKIETLSKTVERLQERIEDLKGLRDLQAAVVENGNESLIPWEHVKAELELEGAERFALS